ncbi:TipC family immunity protein [Streptococcus oralis]|uniref:TipC family immunity protein n=2 Tax=Streptococcus oralis TaxID=1303 RepID=UPI001BE4E4FA|nr:TipC family immunity protein [Streptococcus oralis]MBT3115606.1 TipC family immunity protein [Streptococcus oralis]
MKKILGLVVLFVIIISSCFYFFVRQPKNIFDEIYQETEKTYRSNNILRKIDGFEIREVWPNDSEYFAYTPSGKYQTRLGDYKDISISFNFGEGIKGMTIRFEKRINSDITLWYSAHYNIKKKILKKGLAIFEEPRQAGQYLEDEEKIREYLRKYNISKEELEQDYDKIVNQKVLKDWCSIYDSKYSPSNYGEVKIETQWENW